FARAASRPTTTPAAKTRLAIRQKTAPMMASSRPPKRNSWRARFRRRLEVMPRSSHGLRGGDAEEPEPLPESLRNPAREPQAGVRERGVFGPHDPECGRVGPEVVVRVELRRQ